MTREELSPELYSLYYLMSGASRLLWRPLKYAFASEHIEADVGNSEPVELDKGLGLERSNVADPSHTIRIFRPSIFRCAATCAPNLLRSC